MEVAIPLPTSYPATTTGGDTASPPLLVAVGGPIALACDNNEGRYRIPPQGVAPGGRLATVSGRVILYPPLLVATGGPIALDCDNNGGRYRIPPPGCRTWRATCDSFGEGHSIPPSPCRSWRPHRPGLRQQRGEIPHPPSRVSQLATPSPWFATTTGGDTASPPRVSHLEGDLRQFRGGSFYTPLFLSQEAAPSPLLATKTGGDTASPPRVSRLEGDLEGDLRLSTRLVRSEGVGTPELN